MGGFGGGAIAMITALKNNSRRKKREAYDGWTDSDKKSKGIKKENVSEEVLEEIRSELKKQQKTAKTRRVLGILITSVIVFFLIRMIIIWYQNDPGVSWGSF